MPIDDDLSMSLPKPPPPHPARREAAIEAALRRFDGAGDETTSAADRPRTTPPPWLARFRQPQFGVAVSLAIVAVIGLPAALIAIRDLSRGPAEEAVAPRASETRQATAPGSTPPVAQLSPSTAPPLASEPPATQPPSATPPTEAQESNRLLPSRAKEEIAVADAALPPAASAPAAPSPPPPPAPRAIAENTVGQAAPSGVVVTGSRVRSPSAAFDRSASKRAGAPAAERAPDSEAVDPSHAAFLTRLQAAVRANDRSAVIKLVRFPLRVNASGRSRFYPDARSLTRDFDRIFTPRVRQSILAQQAGQLFTRDQGAMIGDGEVWFDHTCPNSACTPLGPVRIISVNP
jgi:hypothetical protein